LNMHERAISFRIVVLVDVAYCLIRGLIKRILIHERMTNKMKKTP
jgi:hypothetical protein